MCGTSATASWPTTGPAVVAKNVGWERKLEQRYDERVLFNTMTKLPEHHEPILWKECVVPVWDAMAVSLRLFLDRPRPRVAQPPEPVGDPLTVQVGEPDFHK